MPRKVCNLAAYVVAPSFLKCACNSSIGKSLNKYHLLLEFLRHEYSRMPHNVNNNRVPELPIGHRVRYWDDVVIMKAH